MKKIALTIILFVGLCAGLSAQGIETPASALVGVSSGLRVSGVDGSLSGSYSTVIRGLNSLRGDSAPLLIVDGVLIENPLPSDGQAFWQSEYSDQVYSPAINLLGYISVEDIESIEILKDVSATAIYGSRGANGVIVIKTKSSKEGAARLEWKSKGGLYMPGGYMHNHYLMANGSKGNHQFTASGFYRHEDDGYSLMDNHSGGARLMFLSSPGTGAKFGINATFGAQRQSVLNTTSLYGTPSMGLDSCLGNDISAWRTDFEDYAVDYHITTNAFLDIKILKSLNWRTQVSANYQNTKRYTFYGEKTEFGKAMKSAAAIQSAYTLGYLASTELNLNQYISLNHNVKARLSVELSGNRAIYNTMNGTRIVAPHLRAKGLNLVAEFSRIRTFKPVYFHVAALGVLGYTYKNIAGIDATLRIDNTPKYDDARICLYPSVEAFFDIKNLALASVEAVSGLKLTAGWGVAGKENIVIYPLLNKFVTGYYPTMDYDSQSIINGLDRSISKEYNVGLSVGFLKNRIWGQVKYYNKSTCNTLNIYNFASLDPQTQMWKYDYRKTLQTYVDGISNRGLEIDLSLEPIVIDNIKWQIIANACFQSNQISSLCKDDILGIKVGKDGLIANVNAIGYSIGSIYGYDVDEAGQIVDHIPDQEITAEDRIILGCTQPKVFGTFGTSLQLWDFNLDVLFDGAVGHSLLNMSAMVKDRSEYVSAKYVERADFLRMSKLSVGYKIPLNKVKWIQSLELSLTGHNLLCFTGYSGLNPDVDSFGYSNFARGIDIGALPMYKAVLLGLGLKF